MAMLGPSVDTLQICVVLVFLMLIYLHVHVHIAYFFQWCGENRRYQFPFYFIISVTYRYFRNLKNMKGDVEMIYSVK